MASRLELQTTFEGVLGSRNVYFQPPESVKIQYPAIVYKLAAIRVDHANNRAYKNSPSYEATLIDKNPDSKYVEKLLELPYCSFDRSFASDNLNHFVFTIHN